MQEEITLRQHWFTVPKHGEIENHILQLIELEEGSQEVLDNISRNEGMLRVWRNF